MGHKVVKAGSHCPKRPMCACSAISSCHSEHQRDGSLSTAWQASAGGRPGLLFDWALPLLAPPAGAPAPDFSTQFWAAAALGACLSVCDAVPLARYANAALGACQAVLEADATAADLLPPTLNAIRQVLLRRACALR